MVIFIWARYGVVKRLIICCASPSVTALLGLDNQLVFLDSCITDFSRSFHSLLCLPEWSGRKNASSKIMKILGLSWLGHSFTWGSVLYETCLLLAFFVASLQNGRSLVTFFKTYFVSFPLSVHSFPYLSEWPWWFGKQNRLSNRIQKYICPTLLPEDRYARQTPFCMSLPHSSVHFDGGRVLYPNTRAKVFLADNKHCFVLQGSKGREN